MNEIARLESEQSAIMERARLESADRLVFRRPQAWHDLQRRIKNARSSAGVHKGTSMVAHLKRNNSLRKA